MMNWSCFRSHLPRSIFILDGLWPITIGYKCLCILKLIPKVKSLPISFSFADLSVFKNLSRDLETDTNPSICPCLSNLDSQLDRGDPELHIRSVNALGDWPTVTHFFFWVRIVFSCYWGVFSFQKTNNKPLYQLNVGPTSWVVWRFIHVGHSLH